MLKWLSSKLSGTGLTYPRHYEDMLRKTGMRKKRLFLLNVDVNGPYITVTYQWNEDLSHAEADDLDTRARAFIACAIYDATKETGISCTRGPLYGIRPSWIIDNESVPYSVIDGGFDASDKTCYVGVGPCVMSLKHPFRPTTSTEQIAKSFRSCFSSITV